MENRAKTPARSGLAPPKTSNVVLNMPSPSAGAMRAASAQRSASTTKAGLPSGGLSGSSGTSTATRPPSRGAVPSSYASKPASEPVAAARPALPKKRASGGPRQLDAVVLAKAGSTPTVQPPDVVVFFEEEEDDATAVGGNGGDSGTDTLADDASLPDDVTKPFHPSPSVHSSSVSIAGSDVAERGGANVRVVCRVRPMNDKERHEGDSVCVSLDGNGTTIDVHADNMGSAGQSFSFDHVFGYDATQAEIYDVVGKSVVEGLFEGYNGTIFAYGQTASGKTYTMEGANIDDSTTRGIIPRMVDTLFSKIQCAPGTIDFTIRVSMVEIYMEKIRDLLDEAGEKYLEIREHREQGIYLEGVRELNMTSPDMIYDVLRVGCAARSTASTRMNQDSSRSHSVFILTLIQKNLETLSCMTGKLYLVDLAGSEKVRKTGASGILLDQAKKINLSLSQLGIVINALTDGSVTHVPYRDSKLTRLLQESLGGNSRTSLIVNCSPAGSNREETISTLRFGVRAKRMVNKPRVNKERSPAELKAMLAAGEQEIQKLKYRIQVLEGKLATSAGGADLVKTVEQAELKRLELERNLRDEFARSVEALETKYEQEKTALRIQLEEVEGDYEKHFNELQEKLVLLIQNNQEKMQCMADEIAMLKVDLQGKDQQLQDEELRNSKLSSELNVLTRCFSNEFEGLSPSGLSLSVLSPHYIAAAPKSSIPAAMSAPDLLGLESGSPPIVVSSCSPTAVHGDGGTSSRSSSVELAIVPSPFATCIDATELDPAFFETPQAAALALHVSRKMKELVEAKASAVSQVIALRTALEAEQVEANGARDELRTTKAALEAATLRCGTSDDKLRDLQRALKACRDELEASKVSIQELHLRVSASQIENEEARAAQKTSQKRMAALEHQNEQLLAQASQAAAKISSLSEDMKTLQARLEGEQRSVAAYSRQLEDLAVKSGTATSEADQRYSALAAQLESVNVQLSGAKQSLADTEKARDTWMAEAQNISAQLNASLKEKAEAQEALRLCQVSLTEAQKRIEALEKSSRDLTAANKSRADEIKRLSQSLDAVSQECSGAQAELVLVPSRIDAAVAAAKAAAADELDTKLRDVTNKHQTELLSIRKQHADEVASFEEETDRLQARIEQMEKEAIEKRDALVNIMAHDKFTEVTAAVNEVHRQRQADIKAYSNTIEMQKQTMRDLKKEVLKHKRQRNLAISECSHRRLEIAILMSTCRALEVRLELSAEALKSAMMLSEPVQPEELPEELARVREALRVSGDRVSSLGEQLLQSEQREQKLLKDLKAKNERVLELQVAVEAKSEESLRIARNFKREQQLSMYNQNLKVECSKLKDELLRLKGVHEDTSRNKHVLELQVERLKKQSSEMELLPFSPSGALNSSSVYNSQQLLPAMSQKALNSSLAVLAASNNAVSSLRGGAGLPRSPTSDAAVLPSRRSSISGGTSVLGAHGRRDSMNSSLSGVHDAEAELQLVTPTRDPDASHDSSL